MRMMAKYFANLLIGTLVGVALVEVCLVASFLVDKNNGTEDKHFGTDAEEWPQGGELVFNADISLRYCFGLVHEIVGSSAREVTPIGEFSFLDDQLGTLDLFE